MIIDTHTHLDGPEFKDDIQEVVQRAKSAGVSKVFIPAIDLSSIKSINTVCQQFPDFAYPMMGLHPEEVKANYKKVLQKMKNELLANSKYIAVGEVGLDFYWSREFEKEQLEAFEEQVKWSVETRLPLMIHCRKAQNEMVKILRKYQKQLPGGVFHCFTGTEEQAHRAISYGLHLGIGGVVTFKNGKIDQFLKNIDLCHIVLETDSPYLAPVPYRGKRNESAYIVKVVEKLSDIYELPESEIIRLTDINATKIFNI